MKRRIVLSALWTVLCVLGWSVVASALDIVPYLGLKPGKWAVLQNTSSSTLQGKVCVRGTNGQLVLKHFENAGSGWTFGSSEVFKITATDITFVGSNDGRDMWIAEPPMTFPRSINLNQPLYFTGIMRNQRTQKTQSGTKVIVFTKGGLTVDTQAGTFTKCIKVRTYEYSSGISRDAVNLWAPGRQEVKSWVNKIKDTANPVQETQYVFGYEIIDFGDSNAPFH